MKGNPKQFWNYAQSETKTKSSIPDLYADENKTKTTESNMEKVGVLADFFTSVFTQEPDSEFPNIEKKQVPELNDISINPEIVYEHLKNLKISKSPGPDGLHPRILKELKSVLSQPLAIIFNNSIITSKLPDEWECANITALRVIRNMQETIGQ